MRRRGYAAFDRLVCTAFSAGNIRRSGRGGPPPRPGRLLRRRRHGQFLGASDRGAGGRRRPRRGPGCPARRYRAPRLRPGGDSRRFRRDTAAPAGKVPRGRLRRDAISAIQGHHVRWRGWSFHYRIEPRAGLVLSLVRHEDAGRERLVLYRGSVAEMFVPYMDPAAGLGIPRLARCRRVRVRDIGLAAATGDRLSGRCRDARRAFRGCAGPAARGPLGRLPVRAPHRRAAVAACRERKPSLRRPSGERAGHAHDPEPRQL